MVINSKVLVSDAKNFSIDEPINPYYKNVGLDKHLAEIEHEKITNLFEKAGIEVLRVASPPNSQDGVYTANWALCRDKKAVLSRLPNVRKTEEQYAKMTLKNLGYEVFEVPNNLKFSGQGDALVIQNFMLAGSHYRSDKQAQEFCAETLGYELIQLKTIPEKVDNIEVINPITKWPDSFFYDIDLALSIIDEETIAWCPEAFDFESQDKISNLPFRKIEVSKKEAIEDYACNLVSTGETIIMNENANELRQNLEELGKKVLSTNVSELIKGGGFIRCISLTV